MFHTYVASVFLDVAIFKCFHMFLQVFQTHVSSVSYVFKRVFQVLYLNVLKVDRECCTYCSVTRLLELLEGA
jgi:hypothetical protein